MRWKLKIPVSAVRFRPCPPRDFHNTLAHSPLSPFLDPFILPTVPAVVPSAFIRPPPNLPGSHHRSVRTRSSLRRPKTVNYSDGKDLSTIP